MTPDQDLSARLAKLMQAVKSAQNDTDCGVTPFLNKRALYIEALIAAHTSGQLITLADHERAVQAAVAKAVEACAAWHDHEAVGAMNSLHCGSENSEYRAANRLCEFHRASASAIRSRGVAG